MASMDSMTFCFLSTAVFARSMVVFALGGAKGGVMLRPRNVVHPLAPSGFRAPEFHEAVRSLLVCGDDPELGRGNLDFFHNFSLDDVVGHCGLIDGSLAPIGEIGRAHV